jgi:hypothetical protein
VANHSENLPHKAQDAQKGELIRWSPYVLFVPFVAIFFSLRYLPRVLLALHGSN